VNYLIGEKSCTQLVKKRDSGSSLVPDAKSTAALKAADKEFTLVYHLRRKVIVK
jgi:hypothetical protein